MGQAQINVRTRACSGTFIARTKQAALTHNVRGKELIQLKPLIILKIRIAYLQPCKQDSNLKEKYRKLFKVVQAI